MKTVNLKDHKNIEIVSCIIDAYETMLDNQNTDLPNPEKDQYRIDDPTEKIANVFGSDYETIEENIIEMSDAESITNYMKKFTEGKGIVSIPEDAYVKLCSDIRNLITIEGD